MKTWIVVVSTLAVAALLVTAVSHGANTLSRPPGVTEERWMPINETAGFVILVPETWSTARDASIPAVEGYFAVKRGDHWVRIHPVPGDGTGLFK